MKYYNEVLRTERAELGESHPDVVHTMRQIAQVHQARGELQEALDILNKILEIQASPSSLSGDKEGSAQTLTQMGNVYLQYGDGENAVTMYSETARILQSAGKSGWDIAIRGFDLYGVAKLHPECAAVA